ncbi:Oxysterol-binding protein 2 [Strongyloides ratti]|uniref:Oxysterol-binding protein n=1 Tax=Strongyloides ratti TaxID=34506 RepID=A0A090LD04_STRRB|nr:Oxysterol-binding protein 2 [Strongyloides ratti]CEF65395.1 Oxysterol-binding protein 2 [Strongyloides ratti]
MSSSRNSQAGSISSINTSFNLTNLFNSESNGTNITILKQGWLQKWTNYIKGYQQRWFVLDSKCSLAYYRTQSEVNHTCRGSINLQEARIVSEKNTNNITISASTQVFHLKTQNENDRKNWINVLEQARHQAICQAESEDDDLAIGNVECDFKPAIENFNKKLNDKMNDVRKYETKSIKHLEALLQSLNSLDNDNDRKKLSSKVDKVKESTRKMTLEVQTFIDEANKEINKLSKAILHGQEQRKQLQAQLEALAKQHSKLEKAAEYNSKKNYSSKKSSIDSAFSSSNKEQISQDIIDMDDHPNNNEYYDDDSDDDLFEDACETFNRSGTKISRKQQEDDSNLFDAKIVSKHNDENQQVHNQNINSNSILSSRTMNGTIKIRRTKIPEKQNKPLNLWSIMKNCIGKELSKIPMPVNFNEPISYLQRITEDLEYAQLLDIASQKDSLEQLAYLAAFASSCYSSTGETFECDRIDDLGWRSITEQVSHHPPAAAHYAEGKDWELYQDFLLTSKFRGKYLSVQPIGATHILFKNSNNHYTFKKVTTTVHNIIVGKLWIDNHGDMIIENHTTGDTCILKFHTYSYFSREPPRKVTGFVKDKNGFVHWYISGYWDKYIDIAKVTKQPKNKDTSNGSIPVMETGEMIRVWSINEPLENSEKMYNFSQLTVTLNEEEDRIAPTDSRLRPDQRLMENGDWDEANKVKNLLEEKQRGVRRKREAEAQRAMQLGEPYKEYEPLWFEKAQDPYTGSVIHLFKHEYWKCKEDQDWSRCPEIF